MDDNGCENNQDNTELRFNVRPRKTFLIDRIRVNNQVMDNVQAGDSLKFNVGFSNIGYEKIKKVTIRVTVPELGITRKIGPFKGPDLAKGLSKDIYLEIPDWAPAGEYDARITLSDVGGIRRVRHRYFKVVK